MKNIIETPRLRLISCDKEMLTAIMEGDHAIGSLLQVKVASPWTINEKPVFQYSLEKILAHPDQEKWWTYLHVLRNENLLIGCCGFKGSPDDNGVVEIGYEVAESYRLQGFATEIATALIEFSFSNREVNTVIAHTLAHENASNRVLRKCGMWFDGEAHDPDEGPVWKWKLSKESFLGRLYLKS